MRSSTEKTVLHNDWESSTHEILAMNLSPTLVAAEASSQLEMYVADPNYIDAINAFQFQMITE
jgi:hypothetical protein